MITDEQLKKWRALADAATPRPWEYSPETYRLAISRWVDFSCPITVNHNDGKFIAAAREAVPALIDEVERLREENEKLKTEV